MGGACLRKRLPGVIRLVLLSAVSLCVLVVAIRAASFLPVALSAFYGSFGGSPFNDARFEEQQWVSAVTAEDGQNPRGLMAEDLRKRFLHRGMSRREVRALLGDPDNSAWDERTGVDRYFLGHWGPMSIDGDYLIIHYDKYDFRLRAPDSSNRGVPKLVFEVVVPQDSRRLIE